MDRPLTLVEVFCNDRNSCSRVPMVLVGGTPNIVWVFLPDAQSGSGIRTSSIQTDLWNQAR